MVRRSTLVYELLKSERHEDGFTPKEIIDRVSRTYEIAPGKGLRKQVAVALRRGIDFGIIARKNNKYKFDPGSSAVIEASAPRKANAIVNAARSTKSKKKRNTGRRKIKSSGQAGTKSGGKRRNNMRTSSRRGNGPLPPRPKVPKPPNWNPKRRNLAEEPIPKVIKHPSSNDNSL